MTASSRSSREVRLILLWDLQASRNLFAFALISGFKGRELKGLCFSRGIFRSNEKMNAAVHVLWSVLVSHLQCNPEEEDRLAHDIQHYSILGASRLPVPHFSSTDLASTDGNFEFLRFLCISPKFMAFSSKVWDLAPFAFTTFPWGCTIQCRIYTYSFLLLPMLQSLQLRVQDTHERHRLAQRA